MTKPLHPADEFNAKVIASAIEWTAFTQAGGRITNRHGNREDAIADARQLANQFSRPALVYAINAEGRSALAETIHPAKKETTMNTEMSSTQIAQLTAMLTGGGFKRANSKEAAAKRFISVATEKGIKDAEKVLTKTFDEAKVTIQPADAKAEAKKNADAMKAAAKALREKTAKQKAERKAKAPKADKPAGGKRGAALEAAQRGEMPEAPDFSAATHARFRKKLDEIVAAAKAGDIKALKAFVINPVSSSPKAMDKFRNLAVIALEAKKG